MKSQIEFAFSSKSQFNRVRFGSSSTIRYTCTQILEAVADRIAWEANIPIWNEWNVRIFDSTTHDRAWHRKEASHVGSQWTVDEVRCFLCIVSRIEIEMYISSAAHRLVCPIVIGEEELNAEKLKFSSHFFIYFNSFFHNMIFFSIRILLKTT